MDGEQSQPESGTQKVPEETKPSLLKRTSSLFGLLGQKSAVPEADQLEQPIAEEPEGEAAPEAISEPIAAEAEAIPEAEAVVDAEPVEAVEVPESAEETPAYPIAEAAMEEPQQVVQEVEPQAAGIFEASPALEPEPMASAADSNGEVVEPESVIETPVKENTPIAEEQSNVAEAAEGDQDKKVSFEENPQEVPTEAAAVEAPIEGQKEKKKSFFGGIFSRKKEEPAATGETVVPAGDEGDQGSAGAATAAAAAASSSQEEAQPIAGGSDAAGDGEAPVGEQIVAVHSGVAFKPGRIIKSHLKERHFRLLGDNGHLEYSRMESFKKKKSFDLAHSSTVESSQIEGENAPHGFRLLISNPDGHSFEMRCDSGEDRDAWIASVSQVCQGLSEPVEDSAKGSSKESTPMAEEPVAASNVGHVDAAA